MTKAGFLIAASLLTVSFHADAAKKTKGIICSPKVLYPGDTLTIKIDQPFRYLGVTQPIKKAPRTLLVFPATDKTASHSVMDVDQFGQQKKIVFPVKTAQAWFATATGEAMLPVFPKAGSYVFEVGNDLAKNEDKTPYRCVIKYVLY